MSLGLCYYILMLLWLVMGIWSNFPLTQANARPIGSSLLLFILLLLLGWRVFGPPLHS